MKSLRRRRRTKPDGKSSHGLWPGELKNTDLPQVGVKLYHVMLYRVHLAWAGFELTTLVVIGSDCIGIYKSNYHTIETMTAPLILPVGLVTVVVIDGCWLDWLDVVVVVVAAAVVVVVEFVIFVVEFDVDVLEKKVNISLL